MKKIELWKRVFESAPWFLQQSEELKEAFKIFSSIYQSAKNKDVNALKNDIHSLAIALINHKNMSLNDIDFISNDLLIDTIAPIVKDVRIKIFNNPAPPFQSLLEAGQWIYKEAESPIPKDKEEKAKRFMEWSETYFSLLMKNEIWELWV